MGIAYGDLVLVTTYKLRILWREFRYSVRETLEGKLAVVVMVAGPFLVKSMLVSSALRQANLNEHAAWVVLWTAHLAMMAALVSGVASRTARSLILDRREDPLAQYGQARQGLAAFHMWGVVVSAITLWLSLFFYLFYGPLVSRLSTQPVMGTLLHVIGHIVISLALGAVAYRLTLGALELRPALGRRLFWMTGTPAVFAFVAIAGGPQFLLDFAPHRIGELRSTFDSAAPFYAPVAALVGSLAQPVPLLAWFIGVGAAGAIAMGAAVPLIQSPSTLVLGEIQDPESRRFKSVFGGRTRLSTKRVLHSARMFFLKDVLLGVVRSPQSFIRRQTALLGTASLAPVLAWGLLGEGLIGEFEADALILGLVVLLVSAAAYLRGLGALGSEGPALALLRPVVRPADLLGYKTLSVMASVVPAGLLYGGTAGALAKALDMRSSPLVVAGTGGSTGVLVAAFAVSLGFLFPDLSRRNILVPGASHVGRIVFISVAICGTGVTTGLRWMTRSEVLPSELFVPGLITTGGVGMALTGTVMILALRRFPHLEY